MAALYLFDTNVFIVTLKGESPKLLNRLARLAPDRLRLSSVVLAELLTGVEKSSNPTGGLQALEELTRSFELLPFDRSDAQAYARIRAALEKKGQAIGPLDLLIAAQALSRDLVLVTENMREFRRVPGLVCESWT